MRDILSTSEMFSVVLLVLSCIQVNPALYTGSVSFCCDLDPTISCTDRVSLTVIL